MKIKLIYCYSIIFIGLVLIDVSILTQSGANYFIGVSLSAIGTIFLFKRLTLNYTYPWTSNADFRDIFIWHAITVLVIILMLSKKAFLLFYLVNPQLLCIPASIVIFSFIRLNRLIKTIESYEVQTNKKENT